MRTVEAASCDFRQDALTKENGGNSQTITPRVWRLDELYRSFRKQRRGAAAVEFAVVAPIFVLLVFGMIEYGRMVMVQQVVTNASREGARRAVLTGATTQTIVDVVNQYLAAGSISGATVTVTPNPPGAAAFGEPVTVRVQVPFGQVSWLPTPMYLGGTNVSAETVMRCESTQ